VFEGLFDKIKNKWILFGLSAAATLVVLLLVFLLFLRGPVSGIFANQGAKALANGQYEKAENRYYLALSLNKRNEGIYEGYAKALLGQRDYAGAHTLLDRGIEAIGGAEGLYLAKAKAYTAQGDPAEASRFLDGIENTYIHKKLQDQRPANLIFTPAQGRYGNTQKVTLQQRPGEVIYYTLNGQLPTTASAVYTEPITVSSTVTLTAISMNTAGMVSPILQITYEINNANEAIEFADSKLEKMVRLALDQPSGRLYAARLATVTALSNTDVDGQIQSLKDLEYLPGLTSLYLENEFSVDDYTPLAALPVLDSLTLVNCGLGDRDFAAVSACSKLTALTVRHNHITTLEPARRLTYLEYLDASQNRITDGEPLSVLSLLSYLDLSTNGLTDLSPLAGHNELGVLILSENQITDLSPLAGLPKLSQLALAGNKPTNIKKLAGLDSLISLDLSACGLTSLSVVNDFPALKVLVANDNQISSLSTFKKDVTELYLCRNPLVDFTPLQGRSELTILEAAGTQLDGVDFLAGHPNLTILDVSDTKVTDVSVLSTCPLLNLVVCDTDCKTQGLPDTVTLVQNQ